MSVKERVGACGGVGEVPGVGVEVAAGRFDRLGLLKVWLSP